VIRERGRLTGRKNASFGTSPGTSFRFVEDEGRNFIFFKRFEKMRRERVGTIAEALKGDDREDETQQKRWRSLFLKVLIVHNLDD